jgi:hypothetical protein
MMNSLPAATHHSQHAKAGPAGIPYQLCHSIKETIMASNNQGNSKRGFASMDEQKQREAASEGGRASRGGGRGNSQSGNGGGSQGGNSGGNNQSGGSSNRGFASMDPQRQREIASGGGRAAHASGNAHEFTSEEAREAGRMSHKNDGNQQSGSRGNGGGNNGGRGGNR